MMSEIKLRKELFQRIKDLSGEIEEGLKYGVPHVVGEILPGGEKGFTLNLSVATFVDSSHRILLKDKGSVMFMMPVDDPNPRKAFLEVWDFLNGRFEGKTLEPGATIRGVLKTALQRRGYRVIWMNVIESKGGGYVEVIASKSGVRYRMTFEKRKTDEFLLIDMERI